MTKTYYLPRKDSKRLTWLTNFNLKLINHAAALGILAPALLIVLNDTNAFSYTMAFKTAMKSSAKAVTSFLKSLSNGPIGTELQHYPVFVGPVIIPDEITYGIFPRIAILVRQIKVKTECTDEIAIDLGIVGTDIDPAFVTAKPVLSILITAGKAKGRYKKGETHGILVESMRGDETVFSYLLTATISSFIDKRSNLIAGKAENRQYRAWYIVNDEVIGLVSDIVTISVGE